jgi:transmembrane sensor
LVAADLGRSLAWEGGELVFNDEPLVRALERVNRYAETPVTLGDPAAGQVRVSGVFNAGDTAAFVEGVTAAFPLSARSSEGGISLSHVNPSAR